MGSEQSRRSKNSGKVMVLISSGDRFLGLNMVVKYDVVGDVCCHAHSLERYL